MAKSSKSSNKRSRPVTAGDIFGIGAAGGAGYGSYRLGNFISRLSNKSREAFARSGLSDAKLNTELLQDLGSLARGIDASGAGADAYTYATQMHAAANKPLFLGRSAIGSEEGLNEFHNLIRNLGDSITDDLAGAYKNTVKTGKRLGIIDKGGFLRGSGKQVFLDVPVDPQGIKDWVRGMSALKGEGPAWDRSLSHFQAFKESPLDGYRQLVKEVTLANPRQTRLTYANIAGMLEESKKFAEKGFKSREEFLRNMLFDKMSGMWVGSAADSPNAFAPFLSDVANRGGGDYNGFLWNTVGVNDFLRNPKMRVVGPKHLEKAKLLDAKRVAEGKAPKFVKLVESAMEKQKLDMRKATTVEGAFDKMVKSTPFEHVLNRIGKPLSGRRFGMQHLYDAMKGRTVADNIVNPFAAALAKRNASAYSGISKAVVLADILRSKGVKNIGRGLKGLGIALPALALGTTAVGAARKMKKEGSYPGISEIGEFATGAGGIADPGMSRILTTRPDFFYRLNRMKTPAVIAGATLLTLASFLRAKDVINQHRKFNSGSWGEAK